MRTESNALLERAAAMFRRAGWPESEMPLLLEEFAEDWAKYDHGETDGAILLSVMAVGGLRRVRERESA